MMIQTSLAWGTVERRSEGELYLLTLKFPWVCFVSPFSTNTDLVQHQVYILPVIVLHRDVNIVSVSIAAMKECRDWVTWRDEKETGLAEVEMESEVTDPSEAHQTGLNSLRLYTPESLSPCSVNIFIPAHH